MTYEFKKIINGTINIILKNIYPKFVLNGTEKIKKRKCPLCKANKKLNYILEDYEIQTYGKDYRRVVYKKGERTKVCNCFEGNTSPNHRIMRMFMLPTKDRTPLPKNDITQFGKSEIKTIYDSALQKAMECIKSQVQIKEKLKWKINMLRERTLNNQIEINSKKGNNYEKYGDKLLKKFIRNDSKLIEKLKNRFAEKIEYKYDVIRLYDNTYKLIKDKNNGDDDYYIVCLTQPINISSTDIVNSNIISFMKRMVEVILNEVFANDLQKGFEKHWVDKFIILAPKEKMYNFSLDFNSDKNKRGIEIGYEIAKTEFEKRNLL